MFKHAEVSDKEESRETGPWTCFQLAESYEVVWNKLALRSLRAFLTLHSPQEGHIQSFQAGKTHILPRYPTEVGWNLY